MKIILKYTFIFFLTISFSAQEIENIIEQSGYVKKSKYKNLEKIIADLEKRIDDFEKN